MRNITQINIHKFLEGFEENYEWLYNGGDRITGYLELVTAFDSFAETHQDFVSEFVKLRGDFISSDREAAAFMLTMMDMGGE